MSSLSSAERSLLPMQSPSSFSEASRPFLTWQRILDWAQE
ncbi:MAG: Crp/Fnr family transcriptional regulator, partial [Cyanobacteria bacterium J06633_8]